MSANGPTGQEYDATEQRPGPVSQQNAEATGAGKHAARKVGLPLALGIALLPGLFVWFLLRKGHSTTSRVLGFGWAGLLVVLTLAVSQVEPPPAREAMALAEEDTELPAEEEATADADPAPPIAAQEEEVASAEPQMDDEHRAGFHCLSPWDGSHGGLKDAVKDRLRNPGSFEHVETVILPIDINRRHLVAMKYRAENGFGGMNVEEAVGFIDNGTCQLLKLQM